MLFVPVPAAMMLKQVVLLYNVIMFVLEYNYMRLLTVYVSFIPGYGRRCGFIFQ